MKYVSYFTSVSSSVNAFYTQKHWAILRIGMDSENALRWEFVCIKCLFSSWRISISNVVEVVGLSVRMWGLGRMRNRVSNGSTGGRDLWTGSQVLHQPSTPGKGVTRTNQTGDESDANLTAYNNKEVQHAKTLELLHYYRPSERIQIVYNFIKQAVWNRFVLFSSWSVVKVWSDSFIGRVIVQLTLCWPVTAERERVEAWNWPSEQGERLHGLKRARTWQPHILSA